MLDLDAVRFATAVPITDAPAAKAASELVNQASARIARVVSRSVVGGASASSGFARAQSVATTPPTGLPSRANTSNRPKDASVASNESTGPQ